MRRQRLGFGITLLGLLALAGPVAAQSCRALSARSSAHARLDHDVLPAGVVNHQARSFQCLTTT
jgi:hypothetical protein